MTLDDPRFQVPPERAQAEAQLIRIWEALQPYTYISHATPTVPADVTTPEAFEAVRLFASLFADELDLVRRTRNSVVHAHPVSAENLGAAVDIGERLWKILQGRLIELESKA